MIRINRRDIGSYMHRWILSLPFGLMVRVHHIREPDADPELHDHPFSFVSVVLRGWYVEERAALFGSAHHEFTTRRAGSIGYRPADTAHRICTISRGGVWTLVFARRESREWGFWTQTGWVHWKQFHSAKTGEIMNHEVAK